MIKKNQKWGRIKLFRYFWLILNFLSQTFKKLKFLINFFKIEVLNNFLKFKFSHDFMKIQIEKKWSFEKFKNY